MAIRVDSTTDSDDAILAATGNKEAVEKSEEVKEQKSESATKVDESKSEESEPSGQEDSQEEDHEEEDQEDHEEEEGQERPRKKSGFKKRIERFQRRLSEKEQELEYWRRQALKQGDEERGSAKEDAPKTQAAESDKPQADDFDTHEEYLDALTDWKLEQRENARIAKERETKAKTAYQEQVESFQGRVQEFAKSYGDFEDVISDVDDIIMSAPLQEAIVSSELGPAVMYELANNRSEYERINALGPVAAAKEIGKIEARLSNASSKQTKETKETKTTKAPKPIAPVGAKKSGTISKDPERMSFKEYEQWRQGNQ